MLSAGGGARARDPVRNRPKQRDQEERVAQNSAVAVQGKMFLYQQPELLTAEEHGALGITPTDRPYDFVASVGAVPLLASEIPAAQRSFPVVFSDVEKPSIFAVLGLDDRSNLFVGPDGRWAPFTYVPAYVRRYPFALADGGNQRFALVVDRAAATVVENARFPFFENGAPTSETRAMSDFCADFEKEQRRSEEFLARLRELDLLAPRRARYRTREGEERELARYVGVIPERLTALTPAQLADLHGSGMLAAIHAHLFSVDNWLQLLERRRLQSATDDVAAPNGAATPPPPPGGTPAGG